MSRYTLTNTAWGALRVTYGDTAHQLRAECKACGTVTEQTIPTDQNPFEAVQPDHAVGCRYHPTTPRYPPPVRTPHQIRPARPREPETPVGGRPVSRLEALIGALVVLAAVIAGAVLL